MKSDATGAFEVQASAMERPDGSWKADLILYCVKGYDNHTGVPTIGPAVGDGTVVLTLQNGMGSVDALAAAYGREAVLPGLTYIDATRTGPGAVSEFGLKAPDIVFGEEDGSESDRVVRVRDALDVEGIDVKVADDITKELWSKFIYICGLSGSTCITRSTFDQVVMTPHTLEFVRSIMREAYAVSQAKGVNIAADYVDTTVDYFVSIKGENTSSMYTDLMRGKPHRGRGAQWGRSQNGRRGLRAHARQLIHRHVPVALPRPRHGRAGGLALVSLEGVLGRRNRSW